MFDPELEALQAGDVIVFQFGPTEWVAPVLAEPESQHMYGLPETMRIVRVQALREQFGKYPNRERDVVYVPLAHVIAY